MHRLPEGYGVRADTLQGVTGRCDEHLLSPSIVIGAGRAVQSTSNYDEHLLSPSIVIGAGGAVTAAYILMM